MARILLPFNGRRRHQYQSGRREVISKALVMRDNDFYENFRACRTTVEDLLTEVGLEIVVE